MHNDYSLFANFIRFPYQHSNSVSSYLFGNTLTPICVLSDTQYKEALKAQAEREAAVLESQKARYLSLIEQLDLELTKVKTDAGLLPAEVTTDSSMN